MLPGLFPGRNPFRPISAFALFPPFVRGRFRLISGLTRVTGRHSPGVIRLTECPYGAFLVDILIILVFREMQVRVRPFSFSF